MNKPDWKDAPDWAEWLAMDESGDWYWYEIKPTSSNLHRMWVAPKNSQQEIAIQSWSISLEARPDE